MARHNVDLAERWRDNKPPWKPPCYHRLSEVVRAMVDSLPPDHELAEIAYREQRGQHQREVDMVKNAAAGDPDARDTLRFFIQHSFSIATGPFKPKELSNREMQSLHPSRAMQSLIGRKLVVKTNYLFYPKQQALNLTRDGFLLARQYGGVESSLIDLDELAMRWRQL
jgi:hypothetical protein